MMPNTLAMIFFAATVVTLPSVTPANDLSSYGHLQVKIKEFLDVPWETLTKMVRDDPRLTSETTLMQHFNIMLSPMLVSANGSITHAEAMSAFCYNYFQAGMDMTKDHLVDRIKATKEKVIIKQLNVALKRMKELQGDCISTLGSSVFSAIWGKVSSLVSSLAPNLN